MIYFLLFLSFIKVGAFSIGGGYAALPLIQSEIVNTHGWLSLHEFTDLVTIAGMTPGPVAINSATFVGTRLAGLPGALVATLGCILPSIIIVSTLSFIYRKYKKSTSLQNILAILRAAVVAMIASAGLTLLLPVIFDDKSAALANLDWIGIGLFTFSLFVLRKFKINPILVMAFCGCAGLVLYQII